MMDDYNWDIFLKNNRAEIDEFLGPNNPIYTVIGLKGQILKILDKDIALIYFEELINTGKSQVEQNKELLKILNDLRSTTSERAEPQMRFGLNTNSLTSIYKKKVLEILISEVS